MLINFLIRLCTLTYIFYASVGILNAAEDTTPANQALFTEEKTSFLIPQSKPVFILKLKANLTTGYSWFLRDYESELIEPLWHRYVSPANKGLVGAPGYELWGFKVKSAAFKVPEQTIIRLVYARPWDTEDQSKQLIYRVFTSPEMKTSR